MYLFMFAILKAEAFNNGKQLPFSGRRGSRIHYNHQGKQQCLVILGRWGVCVCVCVCVCVWWWGAVRGIAIRKEEKDVCFSLYF